MILERYIPSAALAPFVKTFMCLESEGGMENRILPDTSLVLAICYRGSVGFRDNKQLDALPAAVFSGIRKAPKQVSYTAGAGNLLIVFQPGGAASFFKEPLNEFLGQSVQASAFRGFASLEEVAGKLSELRSNRERINFVEQMLLSKLLQPKTDLLALAAIKKIEANQGIISMRTLARELSISQDAFEKRFRQWIGTTPKHFSSIVRIKAAIHNYSSDTSLTELALSAGYYDQAHFIHDFKQFTLQTPRQFFAGGGYW